MYALKKYKQVFNRPAYFFLRFIMTLLHLETKTSQIVE